jgi:hypothetical protein
MKSKTVTRALLALILLCLAILIVRGLRDGEPEASPQAAAPEPAGPAEAAGAVQGPDATPSAVRRRALPQEVVEGFTPEDIQILINSLLKPELLAEVRVWTAEQLARATIEDETVNAALRAVLEDPDPKVAAAAAAALAQRGEPGVAASPETPDRPTPSDVGDAAPPGMRVETLD